MVALMAQDKDDASQFGPCMQALNPRQQKFVQALLAPDAPEDGRGLNLFAAHRAGYGKPDGSTSDDSLAVTACNLRKNPRVVAALRECFQLVIGDLAPSAARELRFRLNDRKGPTA
jgi:phage terminase small subunit